MTAFTRKDGAAAGPFIRFLLRILLFAALWWVLTGGDLRMWWVGAVAAMVAAGTAWWLHPGAGGRVVLSATPRFLLFFFRHSLRGGLAVASLAMRPRLRLRPTLHDQPLRLRTTAARLFYADLLSLLPGTVSAGLEGDALRLHLLDRGLVSEADLRHAEAEVARLFGERFHGV